MNRNITKWILSAFLTLLFSYSYAQTTVSGTITDAETGEPLIGTQILVKGTVLGTISDVNGEFSLSVQSSPPITLVITYVGYERQEIEVTSSGQNISVQMAESTLLGQEVVVSASRVEENILQSPVSIEKMDILAVQNSTAASYYDGIANLKGVDVASSSINFQIINARGFGSTGNTRFVQYIDGMDTQAPALNFPIGNLNGPSELDVESVELIPGASSALYGPNAFNGVLLINSKNPFEYQGLSAFVKTGVNHVGPDADQDPALMNTFSVRYAKAYNNKFAFKVNATYSYADDWHGTSTFDRNAENNPFASIGGENPGADLLHSHGDEAAINLAIFPFSSTFSALASSRNFGPGLSANSYAQAGDLPNHVVSVTPWEEKYLADYGAENMKLNAGLFYRLNDDLEASYMYNGGFGTSIYTGAQRYSLSNFNIQQHRVQLRADNFFVRAYGTFENSGDSYITEFLALKMNDNRSGGGVSTWLATYGVNYLEYLNQQGYDPGDIAALRQSDPSAALLVDQAAHQYARGQNDNNYFPLDPVEQAAEFERIKNEELDGTIPFGPKFSDATKMYQADAQYDFKNQIDAVELQVGASYRIFDLRSDGTIFPDQDGGIQINEYGAFAQVARRVTDNLKLSGSVRFDKNQNFDGQVNPRISAVYTVANDHNIRASFQTGFRNPTTQGQYIDLNTISTRLLGGLQENYDRYDLDRVSSTGVPLAFTGGSVNDFRNVIFATGDIAAAAAELETFTTADIRPVVPEEVKSMEIGYKSLINNKLLVDAVYYRNIYTNFITQVRIVLAEEYTSATAPNPSLEGTPNYLTILNGSALTRESDGSFTGNTAQIYSNLDDEVTSQGAALGLTYNLPRGYTVGVNYNWNRLEGGFTENNLTEFNTPEHKYNVKFGNRKVTDRLGFNVTYRWQDAFRWESSFAIGDVPAYGTLDAQVSYKLPDLKSVVRLGGTNIAGNPYNQSLGGPNIGSIYYVSVTFDELMN
ncbi:TonB-dependent receptor [Ekhidna sp.]|jgi:iron complex outermembrane receptor protein|uniref:TonB-dependent receptor n=1 Tax=Ekhidna sp. TaxID=2608089 RepID=UPI0032EEA86A